MMRNDEGKKLDHMAGDDPAHVRAWAPFGQTHPFPVISGMAG